MGNTFEGSGETLRWYAGVPIGTNPLILADLARILCALWCLTVCLVSLIQFFLDGALLGEQLWAALGLANRLGIGLGVVFFVIAFLFLQNRYVVLCRLDDEGIYCESMRRGWGPLGESLRWRPFGVASFPGRGKCARKFVAWLEADTLYPLKTMRTLVVRKGRTALIRLHCPSEELFDRAFEFASSKLSRG